MSNLVKTNIPGYYKDDTTGVVINMNDNEYKIYLSQKNLHKEHLKTLDQVDDLKKEVEELKIMLIERLRNNV